MKEKTGLWKRQNNERVHENAIKDHYTSPEMLEVGLIRELYYLYYANFRAL